MKVWVAGQLGDLAAVRAVMDAVQAAGHELTHDWTAHDVEVTDYVSQPEAARVIAAADLEGVMAAEAVVVVASSAEPGRGLFVELGAALARAELGLLDHVVVLGPVEHDSVFYSHPHVRRVDRVEEWLAEL